MNVTNIEWADFTAGPLKYRDHAGRTVWGCVHESVGCQHCYAEAQAIRYGRGGPFNVPTMNELTPYVDEAELRKMRTARTVNGVAVSGGSCFVGSMTDLFGPWVTDALLDQMFDSFEARTDLTLQILTKRAERMYQYLSRRWVIDPPPAHIRIGVSAENQPWADTRIPWLLRTPAAYRFVSLEPLLGPVNLKQIAVAVVDGYNYWNALTGFQGHKAGGYESGIRLGQVIVGAESGAGARPMDEAWVEALRDQCVAAGIAFFYKQKLVDGKKVGLPMLAGQVWDQG